MWGVRGGWRGLRLYGVDDSIKTIVTGLPRLPTFWYEVTNDGTNETERKYYANVGQTYAPD